MNQENSGHCSLISRDVIAGSQNLGPLMPRADDQILHFDIEKGLRVIDRIISCSDEQLSSRSFLLDCFIEYGIPIMTSPIFNPWVGAMNASGFGALQFPTEFIDFLRLLIELRVESAVEIGSYRGGSSYFMAAVLQRANPNASLTLIDIEDNLIGFDVFAQRLNLIKEIPKSAKDFVGSEFDFVFIDGDHSYIGVMRDFIQLGKRARKAVAFHDIHAHEFDGEEGGTVRAWNVVKQQLRLTHSIYEFCHSEERSLGIGVAVAAT